MDAGEIERLVRIDVADSRDCFLIEQGTFDGCRPFCKDRGKCRACESVRKWLRTKIGLQTQFRITGMDNDTTEFPLIGKAEIDPVLKMKRQVLEADRIDVDWYEFDVARHAEVDFNSAAVVEIDQQVFSSPPDRLHGSACEERRSVIRFHAIQNPGKEADRQTGDSLSDDGGFE